jgi:hypothetical protein
MNKKDIYIYYSGATDITGQKLVETLGVNGGKTAPKSGTKMVIGWGAKTKDKTNFVKSVTEVLNHPDAIRDNRNKLKSSQIMLEKIGDKHVAKIVEAKDVLANLSSKSISLPLIGRTKYHQGGKGFWSCPTIVQVNEAINSGANYFQEIVPVRDEYRLHVFCGEVIHAVKKVKRTDAEFEKAFIEDELARQKSLSSKNGDAFDEDTAIRFLKRQAKSATAGGANMLLRSNRLGWKFSIVKKYDDGLSKVAIDAVEAIGLNFGAVDCCTDINGNHVVFEVNSGPGLEATTFEKYIEAFKGYFEILELKTVSKTATAQKNGGLIKKTEEENKTVDKDKKVSEKEFMKMQISRFQDILEETSDENIEIVKRLGNKLIFGGQ